MDYAVAVVLAVEVVIFEWVFVVMFSAMVFLDRTVSVNKWQSIDIQFKSKVGELRFTGKSLPGIIFIFTFLPYCCYVMTRYALLTVTFAGQSILRVFINIYLPTSVHNNLYWSVAPSADHLVSYIIAPEFSRHIWSAFFERNHDRIFNQIFLEN